jgi:hypothetical protein
VPEVIVPAYFHPVRGAAGWEELAASRLRAVVFNVDSGPGTARDREFAVVAARTVAGGVPLLGYVDTRYGSRPPDEVLAELVRYRGWYGVQGVFLDQVSSGRDQLVRYERIVSAVRDEGIGPVVLNHGTYPDAGYAELADLLVTFEGPWQTYERLCTPSWAMRLPASRFCHLVYGAPRAMLGRALRRAARCNTGVVYVTDRKGVNPWSGLPEYFAEELALTCGS